MAMPTLIYCAGGNRRFAQIAIDAGYKFGSQLPETVYHRLYFADQDWRRPNRVAYMAALARHRPTMATVLDWERDAQLAEVLDWAEEAAQYVAQVLIIPKVTGGINRLPQRIGTADVILAYSVPTRYGGTCVPVWEFMHRPVHLLGGSPQAQMRIAQTLDVVSSDGSLASKMATRWCKFWSRSPYWQALTDWTQGGAPAEAFRRSCVNIMAAWRALAGSNHGFHLTAAPVDLAASQFDFGAAAGEP